MHSFLQVVVKRLVLTMGLQRWVHFYKGFVCLPVLGHLACGLIPSFRVIEVGGPISKQCNLVLECWVKSTLELDDDSFVVIIFHQVSEFLEAVNIVINWILSWFLLTL